MRKPKKPPLIFNKPDDPALIDAFTKAHGKHKIISIIMLALSLTALILYLLLPLYTSTFTFKGYESDEVLFEKEYKYSIASGLKKSYTSDDKPNDDPKKDAEFLRANPPTEAQKVENLQLTVNFILRAEEEKTSKIYAYYSYQGTPEQALALKKLYLEAVHIKIGKILDLFHEEIGSRNLDGLKAFYSGLTVGYDESFATVAGELAADYLVGDYEFNEAFYNALKEIDTCVTFYLLENYSEADYSDYLADIFDTAVGEMDRSIDIVPAVFSKETENDTTKYNSPFFSYDESTKEYETKTTGMINPAFIPELLYMIFAVVALIVDAVIILRTLLKKNSFSASAGFPCFGGIFTPAMSGCMLFIIWLTKILAKSKDRAVAYTCQMKLWGAVIFVLFLAGYIAATIIKKKIVEGYKALLPSDSSEKTET